MLICPHDVTCNLVLVLNNCMLLRQILPCKLSQLCNTNLHCIWSMVSLLHRCMTSLSSTLPRSISALLRCSFNPLTYPTQVCNTALFVSLRSCEAKIWRCSFCLWYLRCHNCHAYLGMNKIGESTTIKQILYYKLKCDPLQTWNWRRYCGLPTMHCFQWGGYFVQVGLLMRIISDIT